MAETESSIRGMAGHIYDEIVEMIKQGYTSLEISEEIGWATGTINKIRREEGFRGRIIGPLDHIDSTDFIEDYRSGELSNNQLATKYEIRLQQIYTLLAMYGEPPRQKDPIRKEARAIQIDDAVEMYKKGFYLYEILEETGVDQPTLHKILHQREISLRRPRSVT